MYHFLVEKNRKLAFYSNYRELSKWLKNLQSDNIIILKREHTLQKIIETPVKYICPVCEKKVFGIIRVTYDTKHTPIIKYYKTNKDIEDNTLHRYDFFPQEINWDGDHFKQEGENSYRDLSYNSDEDILKFIQTEGLREYVSSQILDFTSLKSCDDNKNIFFTDIIVNNKQVEIKTFHSLAKCVEFINTFNTEENRNRGIFATQPYQ